MLKNHIKGGLKILGNYAAALLIYVILLYTFIAITGENFNKWLPVYSFIMFILMILMLYTDLWHLAVKEKRPQYELNPYPLKGLVLGLIGFLPFIIIQIVAYLINFEEPVFNNLKRAIVDNILLGPLYFSISLLGKTTIAYIITSLIIPVLSMVAYMAGYYGVELRKLLGLKKEVTYERKQELSPWNPAKQEADQANKKRKKKRPKV
ncbi:MAG TPA: hypothetical protein GX527_10905 [Clostridiaceae bacterium]|jgi:hypothetical protein|nr:hypothetical protein [Clostridiaceae bacterium]